MNLPDLLASLQMRGVRLQPAPGGALHYLAPAGTMTPDLRAAIEAHRPRLVALLGGTAVNAGRSPRYRGNADAGPREADDDAPRGGSPSDFDPATAELVARSRALLESGDLADLSPFDLRPAVRVVDPAKFLRGLLRDLEHPGTPRARTGAAQADLLALWAHLKEERSGW